MKKEFLLALFLIIAIPSSGQKGYINITTFGFLKGTSSDQHEAPLSFISEHSYMLSGRWSAGMITGIEQLKENTMPFAANIRYYQPAGAVKFFLAGYAGYNVSLEKPHDIYIVYEKARGGFMAGTETGLIIRMNDCASLILGIGYRYNVLRYELDDYWVDVYKRNYKFNRLSLKIGILFP